MTDDELDQEAIEIARTTPFDYFTVRSLLNYQLAFHGDEMFRKVKATSHDGIDLLNKLEMIRNIEIRRTVLSYVQKTN